MELKITKQQAEKMGKVEDKAYNVLLDTLTNGYVVDEQTKLAIKVVNNVANNRRSVLKAHAQNFNVAKSISDQTQLERYVAVTQPEIKSVIGKKAAKK